MFEIKSPRAGQAELWLDGKCLLRHSEQAPALFLGRGREKISMFRGNFDIRDRVDERLREIGDGLAYMDMTGERTAFLREVLAMPVESILTVNYSLELEYAAGLPQRVAAYRSELKRTRDLYESKEPFRVYQYFDCGDKQIWHVHGDVAKLSSMVMGHYHYGMLIREIQDYTAEMTRRYRACRSGCLDYQPYSCIDSFLMGDVYILGMGMYLCEADLWWLL